MVTHTCDKTAITNAEVGSWISKDGSICVFEAEAHAVPAVTVVVMTFGEPLYLGRALSSLLSQSCQDFDVVLVDDNGYGSCNQLLVREIAEEYRTQLSLTYVCHYRNRNGSAARNTGIAYSKGRYVSFLDDDDTYSSTRIEKLATLLDNSSQEEYSGAYSGCEFFVNGKHYSYSKVAGPGCFQVGALACTFPLSTGSNLFIRRNVLYSLGGFDPSFERHQDYEFLVRFFRQYSLACVNEVLVNKFQERRNDPDIDKLLRVKRKFIETFSGEIGSCSEDDKKAVLAAHYLAIAELSTKQGRKDISKSHYRKVKDLGKYNFRVFARRLCFVAIRVVKGA